MNTAPQAAEFIRHQYAFAAHIRDPAGARRPSDVEERRMAIYRELFYNNVEGLLASNFPVIRRLLDDDSWHAMVRDFLIRHRCQTPHFPEIAQEFIAYMRDARKPGSDDPPFLLELAHYEWVELAVSIDDGGDDLPATDPNGDLLAGVPLMSPVARTLSYRYPVHRISPEFRPAEPEAEPTNLVVYRDRRDNVRFLEINAVTQRLLQLVKENREESGLDLLRAIAGELGTAEPDAVIRAGAELLADLRHRNILLGTRVA